MDDLILTGREQALLSRGYSESDILRFSRMPRETVVRSAEQIFRELTRRVSPSLHPLCIFIGAQPGSGKSVLIRKMKNDALGSSFLDLAMDDYRSFHPLYAELEARIAAHWEGREENDLDSPGSDIADFTQLFAGDIVDLLEEMASGETGGPTYSILYEWAMRASDGPLNAMRRLQKRGYHLHVRFISVNRRVSLAACRQRAEIMNSKGRLFRTIPDSFHRLSVKRLPHAIDEIYRIGFEQEHLLDSFAIIDRNGQTLWNAGDSAAPGSFFAGRLENGPLDVENRKEHAEATFFHEAYGLSFLENGKKATSPMVMSDALLRKVFPLRKKDAHKGDFGYIALVGGSLPYSGAIRLANTACNGALGVASASVCNEVFQTTSNGAQKETREAFSLNTLPALSDAALRTGAGVVTIASPRSICERIVPQILEATLYPLAEADGFFRFEEASFAHLASRYDVICFGMGIGHTGETKEALRYLLSYFEKTLVIDADGLNALSDLLREDSQLLLSSKANVILTPHMKEFSRLSGLSVREIKSNPIGAAKDLATKLRAIVLLKGNPTVVADGRANRSTRSSISSGARASKDNAHAFENKDDAPVLLSYTGTPGMATAGSGDVLSGILGAIAALHPNDLFLATASAAYINGLAGEIATKEHGEISMTSGDTAHAVERAIRRLTE